MRRAFALAVSIPLAATGMGCAVVPPPRDSAAEVVTLSSSETPLAVPEGWRLAWSDEFDAGSAPDRARWRYETSRNRSGWYNGELQYYAANRSENARIENGRLIVEARVEDISGTHRGDWGGQKFTSARLTTRGRASWRHGFFEVRAKLPCVRGAWPAIWLLPEYQDMRWQGGEIDLAEAVGYEPRTVHHAVQTAARNHTRSNHPEGLSTLDYCGDFHNYQALWTERRIVLGIDGKAALAIEPEGFDRPMALILNVAVGGPWAGAQGIDEAAFPARMEIEHVRIYRKDESQ